VELAIVACRNHPAREAIGVCVKCRARVCGECSTKLDGINHCADCVAALAVSARDEAAPARRSVVGARIAAGGLLGLLALLAWIWLEAAMPG
jgi:hypothetical protein